MTTAAKSLCPIHKSEDCTHEPIESGWCPIHQSFRWCIHNGGELTVEKGWVSKWLTKGLTVIDPEEATP